jgi:O-acetylhomoserine/O-acetylserine sulfhydrylase-like pyridoxal-dependent enzyme
MAYRFETLQIHAGQMVNPTTKSGALSITTAYAQTLARVPVS